MKNKIIMAVAAMSLSASASADVLREKQLYCDNIFSMQRIESAFNSGDKDASSLVIMNEKACHFTSRNVKVIKTMDWPDSQIKKVMIADDSIPRLAGVELWTFGFSLSRK